tara:strand:+ start:260 stop:1105 length:846 start_codon:yes stop_codon:yes gene_type:complete
MATVNLGKIKLKWRGTYAGGTAYTPDDVVEYTDGSVTSTYICVTASTGNAPSSGGSAHSSWNYMAKGQATSPTTTQGDLIVRGASADGRLAIGTAGQVLKVNSGANGLEYGTGTTILQVKNLYYSNTPSSFSTQAGTSLGANSVYYPLGGRFGGTFTKLSSTSKILVFGKMSYIMSSTNIHGVVCWVVGDESNWVNLLDDARNYGTYGSSYAHFCTPLPGVFFNTAYSAGSVTVYAAPAVNGTRNHTGILNGNPHSNSIAGNSDTPNKDGHSMLSIMEFEP